MVNMPPKITPGKTDAENEKKDDKEESKDSKAKIAGPNKWNKAIKKVSRNKMVSIYFVIQHLL